MTTQPDVLRIRAKCQRRDVELNATIQKAHRHHCPNWETWTENVRLMEGGRADMTFDGCREHGIALARTQP